MHEMSLAVSIIDLAVDALSREGGSLVSEVEVEVGNMAGVMIDSLEFCLEAAARATPVEAAKFKIIATLACGVCPSCQGSFEVDSFYTPCPSCGAVGLAITGGQELKVRSIVIEE